MKGGRVRDAHEPEPKCLASTGELIDIERVTISSEGDRWKSTCKGNSLAVYPTSRPVLRRGGESNLASLSRPFCSASNLAETRCLSSPVQGAPPAKTPPASRPSRAHGHHRRPATNCSKLSDPGSNLKLGTGLTPIPTMLARGVTVALGTD